MHKSCPFSIFVGGSLWCAFMDMSLQEDISVEISCEYDFVCRMMFY